MNSATEVIANVQSVFVLAVTSLLLLTSELLLC